MSVAVFESEAALAEAAATHIASRLAAAVAQRGRAFWALSGGGTPQATYRRLAQPPYPENVPWAAVHVLWGDERAVPPDEEGSNYRQAKELLLDQLPLSPERIHRIRGEWPAERAARDYAHTLATLAPEGQLWPRLDIALLGLGSDGHTASLFPGPPAEATLTAPAAAVTADYDGRPAHRITLTPPVFNAARELLFLVIGAGKATAVAATRHPGPGDDLRWPARRLQPVAGTTVWLLDHAAAGKITDQPHALHYQDE